MAALYRCWAEGHLRVSGLLAGSTLAATLAHTRSKGEEGTNDVVRKRVAPERERRDDRAGRFYLVYLARSAI